MATERKLSNNTKLMFFVDFEIRKIIKGKRENMENAKEKAQIKSPSRMNPRKEGVKK